MSNDQNVSGARPLSGKVVLITGGSRGIGAGMARRFGAEGSRVAIGYRNGKAAAESVLADVVAAGGQGMAVAGDIAKSADARTMVAQVVAKFGRIDVLRSSRHIRIEHDGTLLAESSHPVLLFETLLPVRFYLPRDDVAVELEPSDTVSYCAYKGRASYLSAPGGPSDIAWTYPDPLHDAAQVRDLICFFDERVDVIVDGERRARPTTPWSD